MASIATASVAITTAAAAAVQEVEPPLPDEQQQQQQQQQQQRQNMPQHHIDTNMESNGVNQSTSTGSSSMDVVEEKKDNTALSRHDRRHFDDPTPRHKNHRPRDGFHHSDEQYLDGEEPRQPQSQSQQQTILPIATPVRADRLVSRDGHHPSKTKNHAIIKSQSQSRRKIIQVAIPESRESLQKSQSLLEQQQQHHHQQLQQQQPPSKRTRRRRNTAIIEGDASTAFSPYRPVIPLSSLSANLATNDSEMLKKKKKKGKRKEVVRRDKRDHKRDAKNRGKKSTTSIDDGDARGSPKNQSIEDDIHNESSFRSNNSMAQHHRAARNETIPHTQPNHNEEEASDDPVQSILQSHEDDDPILSNYLPQLTFLNDNYYSKVRPYRMGKRNLPLDQIEVILRRRAIKKKNGGGANNKGGGGAATQKGHGSSGEQGATAAKSGRSRPPLPHQSTPPRRKLFPAAMQQQHSPTPSYTKSGGQYDDDSTISSTTIASQFTSATIPMAIPIQQQQQQNQNFIEQQYPPPSAMAISQLPQEEIVGDISLGLKLNILHGMVIISHITPLSDGRASPAQLCGLLSPGDVIVAVDGKSLTSNSALNMTVNMEKITSVLKPLSHPVVDETTGEYSREVRLRLVLGEGRTVLKEQEEFNRRKSEERERRRKLGLDHASRGGSGGGGGGMDPAADLFGFGAFMAVDQHSGMPMFGHLDHHHHHSSSPEKKKDGGGGDAPLKDQSPEAGKEKTITATSPKEKQSTNEQPIQKATAAPPRPTIEAQIAHQIQLDRKYLRQRNTSKFFSMREKDASTTPILRPPSPTQPRRLHASGEGKEGAEFTLMNPMDIRKRRLERGTETMSAAKSLVTIVEQQDLGLHKQSYVDEDPMEVASRACGTASVRTGASKRRWHRGGGTGENSVIAEESPSVAHSRASSLADGNIHFDVSTIRSGDESALEGYCDHRQLVELAANDDSWKMNVVKRLEGYAADTEREVAEEGMVRPAHQPPPEASIDSLLFGGDVASILGKKKQSLALPPGEMTAMLYDLVELLEADNGQLLPEQIFMNNDKDDTLLSAIAPFSPEKAVTFSKSHLDYLDTMKEDDNANVTKATEFLMSEALETWLKSFRPLPWKQRRALWPAHPGTDGDYSTIISSSRMDDNESLSLMSGTVATNQRSIMEQSKEKKRNLREVIEDLELDHETRRETCRLVTFYFTHKFSNQQTLSKHSSENEEEAATFIEAYGSYLDIYKCLVFAGRKLHSKRIVDKLVDVAKYDLQHKEAVKALQKAKVLLFYEPNMLSALLELLPSIATNQFTTNLDFIALLVSAYPDLQPWCVEESTSFDYEARDQTSGSNTFYMEYLSTLLHHEDGNDAAKRDEALVKEWCSMLCSPNEVTDSANAEINRQRFFYIASKEDTSSLLYYRDLPFLMDISVQMSEFGLALSLANEIISSARYCRDKRALLNVLRYLKIVSDRAIKGNEGEINTVLLGQVVSFFNIIAPCLEEHNCEFNLVAELTNLIKKCYTETENNPQYSPSNMDDCMATISENAPPSRSLQVLSQWEYHIALPESGSISPSLISALHTCLIRGSREGVRNELSGSLLRIQRAREEGRRPIVEHGMIMSGWNVGPDDTSIAGDDGDEDEAGGFIWPSVIDGTLGIAK